MIIDSLSLPIGFYSEEARESRNKEIKNYRLYHSRKDSRLHTNEDQVHYLCAKSDPFISSLRQKVNKDKNLWSKSPKEAHDLIELTIESTDCEYDFSSESEEDIYDIISDNEKKNYLI